MRLRVRDYRRPGQPATAWKVYGRHSGTFVLLERRDLRPLADMLHDLADQLDREGNTNE